ncbi:DUF1330 domain-containing protein [Actinomycetes bacterium KLBMP 9759]
MAKGYWIARVDVHDPETYKGYSEAAGPIFAEYGARFLVRGGEFDAVEGTARARNVVLEFPSYEVAQECYRSRAYQRARAIRGPVAEADILLIDGYDGPQPGS